jgi:PAS domain S-box-containing protein
MTWTLYEAIVAQVPEAIVAADLDGTITVWNGGAEALFGFTRDEALGASLDLIIPERFRAAHWAGMRRAIAAGRTQGGPQVRTTRGVHKTGRPLYVDLSFALLTDASGRIVGAVAIGRDATARWLEARARRGETPQG